MVSKHIWVQHWLQWKYIVMTWSNTEQDFLRLEETYCRAKKIFTWLAANLFFNQFSGDILFSFLVSFTFFYSRFFFFVACFLKLKMYILIHIRPCRWVSDKKFFTQPIYGNKTFFWPGVSFSEIYDNNRTIIPFSNRSLFWYHSTLIQSLSPQMGQSIHEWTK